MAQWLSWLEHRPVTAGVEGSSPFWVVADMAQLAEQLTCNQQVIGSSPIVGFMDGFPSWPKGADCKSVISDFEGSNPSPSMYLQFNIPGWSSW